MKRSLLKACSKLVEMIKNGDTPNEHEIQKIRKNTNFFLLEGAKFKSLRSGIDDIPLTTLDYNELISFKKLITSVKNGTNRKHEFYIHKNLKHLVFPFINKNNNIAGVILLQTKNKNSINEVLEQRAKRA
ncbi:MAG: hypothetical protein MI922_10685 [Bacteroidales bacterium]|nr:hypothetical protein [Bacteroidales bacterium]